MKLAPGIVASLLALFAPAEASALEVREAHYVMGTLLEITVEAPDLSTGRAWIRDGIAIARRLDRELTSFDAESPLSRLNREAGEGPRRVPSDLYRIVARSKQLSRESGRTFDVTVGPLVALWNEAARADRWPSRDQIAHSQSQVGCEKIRLQPPDEIELLGSETSIELGGIGKGYAVDQIVSGLRAEGAGIALVNFGESSLYALGAPEGTEGWPIWVRRGKELEGPIRLRDRALSTSRALARTRNIDGRPVGDIFDPRSGMPIAEDRQATVVAPTATEAEAWSKALLVDPDRTRSVLAERPDWATLLHRPARSTVSGRFAAMTGWSPESR